VISMSLGAPGPYSPLEEAIKRAVSKGVIVVCAAGNNGVSVDWPGAYTDNVCVAAFNDQLMIADFSGRGPEVDVAAPGVNVISLYPGGQVASLSGTSMATPYVAGVAALYVSACKKAGKTPTPTEFRKILEDTSASGAQRPNPNSGWGRILADKYVDFAPSGQPGNGKEYTFTQPDFTADGWRKLQEAGLQKLTIGTKGSQPQTTPAAVTAPKTTAPAESGTPTKPTGKTPV
jgi:subtilisin family serine protease